MGLEVRGTGDYQPIHRRIGLDLCVGRTIPALGGEWLARLAPGGAFHDCGATAAEWRFPTQM